MGARTARVSWALLVLMGLASGWSLAEPAKSAPVKTPLEVTYYYLPG